MVKRGHSTDKRQPHYRLATSRPLGGGKRALFGREAAGRERYENMKYENMPYEIRRRTFLKV